MKMVMKVMVPVRVVLARDYHPEDYEDCWLDKGREVWATYMPNRKIYLAETESGSQTFNTDARHGVDFIFMEEAE